MTSAALLFLTVSASSRTAHADDAEVSAKLERLSAKLDEHERASRLWYYGWTAFFVTASAAEGAFAVDTDDRELRANYAVGSFTSLIGAVTTIGIPSEGVFAPPRIRAMKGDTEDARRLKLAAAEKAIEEIREQERLGQSWLAHAGGVVVNGAAGLVLWKGYGYGAKGLSTFLVGLVVSEIKIFTQPTWARTETSTPPSLSLGVTPGGLSLRYSFD